MLPDLLLTGLDVVFCGTAVATASAERGHYYSGPGNKFWHLLHDAGFTASLLRPEDDLSLLGHGVGITDLVKGIAQSHDRGLDYSRVAEVAGHIIAASPAWIAFNGKTAGGAAAAELRLARRRDIQLGEQSWTIGVSRVFVLPSSSGAHAAMPYVEKLNWWKQLRDLSQGK